MNTSSKTHSQIKINTHVCARKNSGQVIMGSLLMFLSISIVVLVGIATPVAVQVRSAADFLQSKQGYITADVLNEESLYRLNKGWTLPSTLVLSFNESTSTALITDVDGKKQIIATGVSGLFSRISKSVFTPQGTKSVNISYATQIGNGGLTMDGSPTITGNAISNGNITGSGVSTITGNALSSISTPESTDQSNGSGTPAVNLVFGNANATQDFAQSFTVSTTTSLSRVLLYMKKTGTPSNITVRVTADSSGNPAGTSLATATLNVTQIATSYSWVPVVFTSNTSLTPGTTYWLVLDVPSNSNTSNFTMGISNTDSYRSANSVKMGRYNVSSWTTSTSNYDAFFKLYLGGVSSISGVVVNGFASAYSVSNSTVSGALYCQSGSGNNKSCNTSSSTPVSISYPLADSNITDWKAEATAGGVRTGNVTINGVTATTTGPIKINGNLTISESGRLTMTGTIYVTGDVTINGAANLSVDSSYGAKTGVLIADGKINVTASGAVSGSGTAGSYVLFVTTSTCGGTATCSGGASAITVSGAAGAVVLFAPNGKVAFTGSASAKAVAGYAVSLSGATQVNYESGLSSLTFSSTQSSGTSSWVTDTWKEIFQ